MSSTYTDTGTQTFSCVHAKRISYRVATDLKRDAEAVRIPDGSGYRAIRC